MQVWQMVSALFTTSYIHEYMKYIKCRYKLRLVRNIIKCCKLILYIVKGFNLGVTVDREV